MGLTREQIKQYIRSKVKHLKDDAVNNNMLDIDLNFSRRDVQGALMDLGIDIFKKEEFFTGKYFNLPVDIMPTPKPIIDVLVSSGTKAKVITNMAGTNNDIVLTAKEPGENGTGIKLVIQADDTQGETPEITTDGKIITAKVNLTEGSFGSANGLISAIKDSLEANDIIDIALKTGNDGTGEVAAGEYELTGGAGKGWKRADELSVEKYNHIVTTNDFTQTPTEDYPKFVITGKDNKITKQMRVLPATTKYVKIIYWYTLLNLSADTETMGIPDYYENLVIATLLKYTYEGLEMNEKAVEIQNKIDGMFNKIKSNYTNTIGSFTSKKEALKEEQ